MTEKYENIFKKCIFISLHQFLWNLWAVTASGMPRYILLALVGLKFVFQISLGLLMNFILFDLQVSVNVKPFKFLSNLKHLLWLLDYTHKYRLCLIYVKCLSKHRKKQVTSILPYNFNYLQVMWNASLMTHNAYFCTQKLLLNLKIPISSLDFSRRASFQEWNENHFHSHFSIHRCNSWQNTRIMMWLLNDLNKCTQPRAK